MAANKEEVLRDKALTEELREHFREEFEVENGVESLQEENSNLKEELAEIRTKEKMREDAAAVDLLLKESKIPDDIKNDKDIDIRGLLEEADPERRPAIIARFEKAAKAAGGPAPSGQREKDIRESVGSGGESTASDRASLARGMMSGITRR